jgi:hypothetical protein
MGKSLLFLPQVVAAPLSSGIAKGGRCSVGCFRAGPPGGCGRQPPGGVFFNPPPRAAIVVDPPMLILGGFLQVVK